MNLNVKLTYRQVFKPSQHKMYIHLKCRRTKQLKANRPYMILKISGQLGVLVGNKLRDHALKSKKNNADLLSITW